jgi:uncharacterized protein (DUF1501 family)
MYNAGEALFVHAIASPYRERSHFDGQNVIETGGSAPYQVKDAWLNRLVALLPKRKAPPIALTPTVPMALRTGMGPAWMKTTVLVATEFGRTVAVNGTKGTDHGTATAAMLIGGAVQGGRVLTEWPGLSQAALYDNRDLKATMSLDAFIAGAVGESFVIDPALVARTVFKEGSGAKPMTGLLRSWAAVCAELGVVALMQCLTHSLTRLTSLTKFRHHDVSARQAGQQFYTAELYRLQWRLQTLENRRDLTLEAWDHVFS